MRILILDGANKNALAIVRHLGKLAAGELDIGAHTRYAISFYSKYARETVLLPDAKQNSEEFVEALLQHLRKTTYDLLIPVGFKSFQVCAENQDTIRNLTNLVITTTENIKLASSKIETCRLAKRLGMPHPKTVFINTREQLENLTLDYPIVIKAPFEAGHNLVEYVQNGRELREKYDRMCEKYDLGRALPILQEYIPGEGYGFFAFYEDGVCKRTFMHRRIREYPVTGGASVCAESFYDPELESPGLKMLDYLHWHGVAMVEFKRDTRDGVYKLMEINPKFWGSLDLALEAGVNFPYFLVRHVMGAEIDKSSEWAQVRFQWLLNGEFFHLFYNPRAFFSVVKDLFKSKNDVWFSDMKPNFFQLLVILEFFYKKMFK